MFQASLSGMQSVCMVLCSGMIILLSHGGSLCFWLFTAVNWRHLDALEEKGQCQDIPDHENSSEKTDNWHKKNHNDSTLLHARCEQPWRYCVPYKHRRALISAASASASAIHTFTDSEPTMSTSNYRRVPVSSQDSMGGSSQHSESNPVSAASSAAAASMSSPTTLSTEPDYHANTHNDDDDDDPRALVGRRSLSERFQDKLMALLWVLAAARPWVFRNVFKINSWPCCGY